MSLEGYTSATSVAQGATIDFHVNNMPAAGNTTVQLVIDRFAPLGSFSFTDDFPALSHPTPSDAYAVGCGWPSAYAFEVPATWPSGYYRATLTNTSGEATAIPFVVRASEPGSGAPVLFCVPVTTFQAYNSWGGKSLYLNEAPERSKKVSFQRPGGSGPGNELALAQWLANNSIDVEFCTSVDLHSDGMLLCNYKLLISSGHDEYWSKEMRDHVEAFIAAGGNVAFFSGNTCWWQVRFEDDNRTLICYRDALEDPLAGVDNQRVTVQWHAAPVNRPENTMTGVSYRKGAGCWIDESWRSASYTVNFPDHWVFEGTGLSFGATFGAGSVGHETDGAELQLEGSVMRATCRDGTPPSFVVLAWADLSHWRAKGQGGLATMGVYCAGGTVFTAGTMQWADKLDGTSPAVECITRNVIGRLSDTYPSDAWERIGHANDVAAMTACEGRLFAATHDNTLWWRETVGQNLDWTAIGEANDVLAMAAPIEAADDRPVGLYAVTDDTTLWWREPVANLHWTPIGHANNVVAMAASNYTLFVATGDNRLWARPTGGEDVPWQEIGHADNVIAMTGHNGKLYCVTSDGRLWWRQPVLTDVVWTPIGTAPNIIAIAGAYGKLFAATSNDALLWRDARA
jgi:N,N-dimethylformamidase beta subunit-like protein